MKLNVRVDGHSFAVEVGDLSARPIRVTVEGEVFDVYPEEVGGSASQRSGPAPQPATPMVTIPAASVGAPPARAAGGKTVAAPIPGVIVALHVKAGDTVAVGQELCVLEAMKMKNNIRSPRAGTVAAVPVAVGDQVKHGQALVEFSD